jgi:hypothetical protein
MMLVRLTRKLADMIDGIDLSGYKVGELLQLPVHEAKLLIAERWAELIERRRVPRLAASGTISSINPD